MAVVWNNNKQIRLKFFAVVKIAPTRPANPKREKRLRVQRTGR